MAEQVIDPETMSMEDLRKAAEEEARKQSTQPSVTADDDLNDDDVDSKGPFFTERTIDLGDGAGVQVFKGKGETREEALEDLTDKLAEAQRNATRKIRELAKAQPTDKKRTKEEEAIISQNLLTNPSETIEQIANEAVRKAEEKRAQKEQEAIRVKQEKDRVASQFIKAHPEFVDNDRNGKKMTAYLTLHNDFSLDGFEKAYQDLTESGLLEVKDEGASAEQKDAEAERQRIAAAAKDTSSQRTKKSSGISTQRKSVTPVSTEASEDDMYNLPLDELRKRANQQLAAAR